MGSQGWDEVSRCLEGPESGHRQSRGTAELVQCLYGAHEASLIPARCEPGMVADAFSGSTQGLEAGGWEV